jgi:hypothetical protein
VFDLYLYIEKVKKEIKMYKKEKKKMRSKRNAIYKIRGAL